MKYIHYLSILTIIIISFQGCGTQDRITLPKYYSQLQQHQPKSILVLPPVNHTTSVDASNSYLATLNEILSDKGYYVFPTSLVNSFFKSENLSDPEIIRNIKLEKLNEVFNADAILYVDIFEWDTIYRVLSSNVVVGIKMTLVDAKTKKEIWYSDAHALSRTGIANGGIIELIASSIAAGINSKIEYTKLAFDANAASSFNLLAGSYSPDFQKDLNKNMYFAEEERDLYKSQFKLEIKNSQVIIPRPTSSILVEAEAENGKLVITPARYHWKYSGLVFNNPAYFLHNNFDDFYYNIKIDNQEQVRHRFFNYENNKPFIIVDNKKVFLKINENNKFIYHKESGIIHYDLIFDIDHTVE